MKLKLFTIYFVLLVMLLATTTALAAPGSINGRWTGIDIDGSHVQLMIGGGSNDKYIELVDDVATVACPVTHGRATATGDATFDGTNLSGTLTVRCPSEGTVFDVAGTWTYDSSTDTLTDWLGVDFTR